MTPQQESLARDEEARRIARQVFDRPLVLEAGAGTGKTTTLVARVLAWTLGEGWRRNEGQAPHVLARVVAITFTEAAAAQMGALVRAAWRTLAEGKDVLGFVAEELEAPRDELGRRAQALLFAADHLRFTTIHAFCRQLLVRWAMPAGQHPSPTIDAEEVAVRAAADEALAGAMARVYGQPGDQAFLYLAQRGIGPAPIVEAATTLLQQGVPLAILAQDPLAPERVRGFVTELHRQATEMAALLAPIRGQRQAKGANEALALVERLAALSAGAGLAAWRSAAAKECRKLADWSKLKFSQTESNLLGGRCDRISELAPPIRLAVAALQQADPELLAAARAAVGTVATAASEALARRGVLSFDQLLRRARDLLRDDEGVRRAVRAGIDQLLVDEFQDTNDVQCEIVAWLALDGPPAERPGLFLVGDPKQSIFGWREADLRAYDAFLQRVAQAGGERHALVRNFRSLPPILAEVARTLGPNMRREYGVQPEFVPLVPTRDDGAGPAVEHWVAWDRQDGPRTNAKDARRLEAKAIAADIDALRARGVPLREVAILLRSRGDLDLYLGALRERDLPFVVDRDDSYYQRREVQDLAATLRAILDPGDQLALLTYLRAPFVGAPDPALLPLWSSGRDVDAAAREIPPDAPALPPGWQESVRDGLVALDELRDALRNEPADRFLRRLRSRLLPEAVAAARYLGAYRLANVQEFFRQVEAAFRDPERSPEELLRELQRGVAGQRRREEGKPCDDTLDAVRVLTIHGAKGLEFQHVYLADLHRRAKDADPQANFVAETEAGCEIALLGARSLGCAALDRRREVVEAAEAVRLLYVATTRSKDRLVLSGCWPLERLELRPGIPDLEREFIGRKPGEEAVVVDEFGVPWRLLDAPEDLRSPATPRAPPIPYEVAEAHERELAALRDQAARRQARPFVASVTAAPSADEDDDDRPRRRSRGRARDVAAASGTLVHKALERFPESLQRPQIEALLPGAPKEAVDDALALLVRFAASPVGRKLRDLLPHGLARELPFVLVADPDGGSGPVGASFGTIDLVYRDPATDEVVVADYKTDTEVTPEQHRAQLDAYAKAVQRAFALASLPRRELWYLRHDRVVSV
jgi:ATP-dependent helicase/nuclease subunit A